MAGRRLEKPKLPDVKICLWEDLTFSGMELIEKASTVEELKQALHQLLSLPIDEANPRDSILLDLYVYTLQFAKSQGFNREQTSTTFSIVKRLHEAATATSLGNVEDCFRYVMELIMCHSVKRPPFSIDLFNVDQVRLIADYIVDTYFQHFKLYKYVFTKLIRLDLSISYDGIPETPPVLEDEVLSRQQVESPAEEAEVLGEPAEAGPGDQELRQYIEARLSEQVSQLRTLVEGRLRDGEQRLNQKLLALEMPRMASGESKAPRSRRK